MNRIVIISRCSQCPNMKDISNTYNMRYKCAVTGSPISTEDALDMVLTDCPLPEYKQTTYEGDTHGTEA